ncbi:MAG: tetratricopeptide repeat protein, partial [Bdellovibrionales bacterium]|nr:tetratricopeptide repeat protein [Bdellovibrionales bacterium]
METFKAYQEILGKHSEEIRGLSNDTVTTTNSAEYDMAPLVSECQELLEKGEAAAREKDFASATQLLNQSLNLNPTKVRTLIALGAVYLAQSQIETALEYFSRGEMIDSKDPKILSGKGMCLMMKEDQESAHDCFVRAINEDANDQVAILQLIEASYAIGRFEELANALKTYTDNNPENNDMLFCYAGCLFRLGDLERSEEVNNKVLQSMPMHKGALELRDILKTNPAVAAPDTRIIESEVNLQQASWTSVQDVPGFSVEDRLFELEYLKRDRKTEEVKLGAIDILNSKIATEAQREQASLLLAEVAVLEENIEIAQKMYADILAVNPMSARAITGQGAILANQGQWEEARSCFVKSAEIDPDYDVPFAGLGLYHTWKQELDIAMDLYQEALKRNPENQRAVLGAIEVGFALSRFSEVEAIVSEWLDHKPGDLDLIYSLAGCLYSQGKMQEASSELEKVFIFNPDHKGATELYQRIKQETPVNSNL